MKDVNVSAGYKSADIGVIPEDWNANKLGDIAIISSGGTPSRSNPSYWNGDIPWITTTQINFNTIFSSEEFITKLGLNNSSAKLYDKNTLLMAMYGQGKTRGKVAILGIEATINQACASILVNRNNSNQYIFFYLSHKYEEIRKLSNTGNQENLNGNLIKNISLPLPPLPEQKAIARVLSDVDDLIRECDSLLAKKRDIKQGTMQQLLTGKKRLPGFSGEWKEKKLGEIVAANMGQSPDSKHYNHEEKGIPLIQGNADILERKSIERVWTTEVTKTCDKDNIVMTVRAPVGTIGFASNYSCIGRGVCSFQTKNINKDYFFYLMVFNEKTWENVGQGSTFTAVNSNDINNFQLLTTSSHSEQKAIAEILSDMDAAIEALEQKRDKYKAIKQGMMQELLTGKTRLIENG